MRDLPESWPSHLPYPIWYLDAVCSEHGWDYVQTKNAAGAQESLLPFQYSKRWGLRLIKIPPLCPQLGPMINLPVSAKTTQQKNAHLHRILTDLDDALPGADYYCIRWPYKLTNGLPWQMLGWQQNVRYSYVLPLGQAQDTIWKNIRATRRHEIRKAAAKLRIEPSTDWQLLFQLVSKVFEQRGVGQQVTATQIKRLYEAGRKHQSCQLWVAKDQENRPHAAMLMLYDKTTAYNLLLGSDPTLRHSGAVALLLWHAIQWSKAEGLTHFDFEGSHLPGVEPFFRSFGAEAWPYYEFVKGKKWLLALKQLR